MISSIFEEFGYVGLESLSMGAPIVLGPLPGYDGISAPCIITTDLNSEKMAEGIRKAVNSGRAKFPLECTGRFAVNQYREVFQEM